MTRQDILATTARTFHGKTKEQVIDAAVRVLTLADEEDFQFMHVDEGFRATRQWAVYLVLGGTSGWDYWNFTVSEVGGVPRAAVQVSTVEQAVIPLPTTSRGGWAAGTTPANSKPVQGTALYDVFWARMEYMLHQTDRWMTCKEANARVASGKTHGSNAALCNAFNVDDFAPNQVRPARLAPANSGTRQEIPSKPKSERTIDRATN